MEAAGTRRTGTEGRTARTEGRRTAAERREEILGVAMEHFAIGGYRGTSTEAIAREAGISQPYLFRLFRTKKELFLACCDRAHDRLYEVFRAAAARAPAGEALQSMGKAYVDELLPDRHAILMQLQCHAASSDPDIQRHVRRSFGEMVDEVTRLSGADADAVWDFFAKGMLLNVTAALGRPGRITGYCDEEA